METLKRARIEVDGRVQGVGYRFHTLQIARELGLTGFVRNQPDGSVLIEAQGPEEAVSRLIEWCRSGPARAEVTSVEYSFLTPVTDFPFQIR